MVLFIYSMSYTQNPNVDYQEFVKVTLKEKYFYLLLGFTVFVLIFVLAGSLLTKRNSNIGKTTQNQNKMNDKKIITYTVKEGESLWQIAEKAYGSGYNAYDIAQKNNITDPNNLTEGQKLLIPPVEPKDPTQGEILEGIMTKPVLKQGKEYVIQEGDDLWKIAEMFYGDGNLWTRIAQANQLVFPDSVHAGNKLVIPR